MPLLGRGRSAIHPLDTVLRPLWATFPIGIRHSRSWTTRQAASPAFGCPSKLVRQEVLQPLVDTLPYPPGSISHRSPDRILLDEPTAEAVRRVIDDARPLLVATFGWQEALHAAYRGTVPPDVQRDHGDERYRKHCFRASARAAKSHGEDLDAVPEVLEAMIDAIEAEIRPDRVTVSSVSALFLRDGVIQRIEQELDAAWEGPPSPPRPDPAAVREAVRALLPLLSGDDWSRAELGASEPDDRAAAWLRLVAAVPWIDVEDLRTQALSAMPSPRRPPVKGSRNELRAPLDRSIQARADAAVKSGSAFGFPSDLDAEHFVLHIAGSSARPLGLEDNGSIAGLALGAAVAPLVSEPRTEEGGADTPERATAPRMLAGLAWFDRETRFQRKNWLHELEVKLDPDPLHVVADYLGGGLVQVNYLQRVWSRMLGAEQSSQPVTTARVAWSHVNGAIESAVKMGVDEVRRFKVWRELAGATPLKTTSGPDQRDGPLPSEVRENGVALQGAEAVLALAMSDEPGPVLRWVEDAVTVGMSADLDAAPDETPEAAPHADALEREWKQWCDDLHEHDPSTDPAALPSYAEAVRALRAAKRGRRD